MIDAGLIVTLYILVPLVTALCVTAVTTRALIPFLKRVKTTQTIHEDVPDSHHRKGGTPTMGGIAIIAGVACGGAVAMAMVRFSANMAVILAITAVFGLIGFLDDYTKVVKRRNLGLTAKQKILLQFLVALILALYYVYIAEMGTTILVPFLWKTVDIGLWMIPYIVFIVVSMVNSVNLTDGLDGLAGGVTAVLSLFYPVIMVLALNLGLNLITGTSTAASVMDGIVDSLFFASLAGACIGFLIYNRHPAKIFMGDTGSLALGGGIAAAAILMRMELFLPIIGLVFVAEALSDIIQVASYKLRNGKRVFKMAPLHHHFELSGWPEKRVVITFVSVTLVLCAASVVVMLLQTRV